VFFRKQELMFFYLEEVFIYQRNSTLLYCWNYKRIHYVSKIYFSSLSIFEMCDFLQNCQNLLLIFVDI